VYSSFEDMPVWQKSMDMAQKVFSLTDALPRKEDYGLTSQVRRAALSVSGNLAEGFGRHHTKDKLNFYYASRGSLTETKSHILYGQAVGYFKPTESGNVIRLADEIWKELNALIHSLRRTTQP
jgi:four helix bundle protein